MTKDKEKQREASRRWYLANKEQANQRDADRRARMRAILHEAKNVPCADCGKRYPSIVMDFDHRDGVIKLGDVANMINQTEARLRAEMAKCDVVCANCHRIRTATRAGWIGEAA